jgi:hypothetical protein
MFIVGYGRLPGVLANAIGKKLKYSRLNLFKLRRKFVVSQIGKGNIAIACQKYDDMVA